MCFSWRLVLGPLRGFEEVVCGTSGCLSGPCGGRFLSIVRPCFFRGLSMVLSVVCPWFVHDLFHDLCMIYSMNRPWFVHGLAFPVSFQ